MFISQHLKDTMNIEKKLTAFGRTSLKFRKEKFPHLKRCEIKISFTHCYRNALEVVKSI